MDLKIRFVAYDHLGNRRGVLNNYLQASPVVTHNELPTLTLTYPRRTNGHKWLQNNPEIAMEMNVGNSSTWSEPGNCRWVLQNTSFNYLEEVETIDYNFIGIGEVGKYIYVYDSSGFTETDEGKVEFKNMTPGYILLRIWQRAEARGWNSGTGGYLPTWNDQNMGIDKISSITFDKDTSFDAVLNYFVRTGLVDYKWTNRWLMVERKDSNTNDLTTGEDPIKFHLSGGPAGVDSAPEQGEHSMGVTHIVVVGEENARFLVTAPGVTLADKRRELFIQHGGVKDMATAQIVAAPTFERYNKDRKNTTRQFQLNDHRSRYVPLNTYRTGSWVLVEKADGEWEKMQIRQIGLTINHNGIQGYASMGDKVDSIIEKFDARLQRLQSGLG